MVSRLLLAFAIAMACGPYLRGGETPHELTLRDGSVLPGVPVTFRESELTWRTAAGESRWPQSAIQSIRWRGSSGQESSTIIQLDGGDQLNATNVVMEPSTLRFRFPWTSVNQLPTNAVTALQLIPATTALYSGPKDMKEWKNVSGWTLKDNALHSGSGHSRLQREFEKWPDRARLAFDLTQTQQGSFTCQIHRSSGRSRDHGIYYLNLSLLPGHIRLQAHGRTGSKSTSKSFSLPTDGRPNKVEVEMDMSEGNVRVFVNGKKAAQLQGGGNASAGKSDGKPSKRNLTFYNQTPGATLANIRVIPLESWDERSLPALQLGSPHSHAHLASGEVVAGDLIALSESELRLKSLFGELKIPRDRLRSLALPSGTPAVEPELPGWQLTLASGARLRLTRLTLQGEELLGRHRLLGTLTIPLDACRSLTFPEGEQ